MGLHQNTPVYLIEAAETNAAGGMWKQANTQDEKLGEGLSPGTELWQAYRHRISGVHCSTKTE